MEKVSLLIKNAQVFNTYLKKICPGRCICPAGKILLHRPGKIPGLSGRGSSGRPGHVYDTWIY